MKRCFIVMATTICFFGIAMAAGGDDEPAAAVRQLPQVPSDERGSQLLASRLALSDVEQLVRRSLMVSDPSMSTDDVEKTVQEVDLKATKKWMQDGEKLFEKHAEAIMKVLGAAALKPREMSREQQLQELAKLSPYQEFLSEASRDADVKKAISSLKKSMKFGTSKFAVPDSMARMARFEAAINEDESLSRAVTGEEVQLMLQSPKTPLTEIQGTTEVREAVKGRFGLPVGGLLAQAKTLETLQEALKDAKTDTERKQIQAAIDELDRVDGLFRAKERQRQQEANEVAELEEIAAKNAQRERMKEITAKTTEQRQQELDAVLIKKAGGMAGIEEQLEIARAKGSQNQAEIDRLNGIIERQKGLVADDAAVASSATKSNAKWQPSLPTIPEGNSPARIGLHATYEELQKAQKENPADTKLQKTVEYFRYRDAGATPKRSKQK